MVAIWLTMHHKSVAMYQHGWHYWIINFCLFFLRPKIFDIFNNILCIYCSVKANKFWSRNLVFQKTSKESKQQLRGINVKFILSALFKCILPNNNNNHNSETQLYKTKHTNIPPRRLTCCVHLHTFIYFVWLDLF